MELPTDLMTPIETSVAQILEEQTPKLATLHSGNSTALNPSLEKGEEVEIVEQGNRQEKECGGEGSDGAEIIEEEAMPEQTKGKLTKGGHEVIALEEDESEDGEEWVGKQITTTSREVKRRSTSQGVVIQEPAEDLTTPLHHPDEEQESEAMETSESEGVYEKLRVTIDHKLQEAMVSFKDPTKRKNCAGRGQKGKKAKSGRRVHPSSLRGLGVEEQFFSYIKAEGFEWLLEHSLVEVLVDLAREFFISFYFTHTTDLDAPSIRFRVFNQEMPMTLREWSLCLGLLTPEVDEAGEWADREIGQPEDTDGFDAQAAWKLITTEEAAPFKTSVSKGTDIINPALRLAQVFLACNLLGQANGTIATPELYFMWCMLTDVMVHLGYWIAQAIHKITRRPVRHLYAYHLLGAYLQRNVTMTIARPRPIITMCDSPDWFDTGFLINSGLVTRDEKGTLHFYEVGQPEETPIKLDQEVQVEGTAMEVKKEVEENSNRAEGKPSASKEKRQRKMEHLPQKVERIHEDHKRIFDLQSEDMNKAFSLVETMTELAEMNSQIAQHLPLASISKENQQKEAKPDANPVRTPLKRKDATANISQSTAEEGEVPARRVKLARTRQLNQWSGSQESQKRN